MLLFELHDLLDQVVFPCTYNKLMVQCEKKRIPEHIVRELEEKFKEEFQDGGLIDEYCFEELEEMNAECFPYDE